MPRFSILFLSALLAAGCFSAAQGDGRLTSETRDVVGSFDGVENLTGLPMEIRVGEAPSVEVLVDGNLQRFVQTEVVRGRLVLEGRCDCEDRNVVLFASEEAVVRVTLPELRKVVVQGSGDFDVTGLDGGALELVVNGSGDVALAGALELLEVEINGSGDIHARDLTTDEAALRINGSGDVEVGVERRLEVVINGSGDIVVLGNPHELDQEINGSGRVTLSAR